MAQYVFSLLIYTFEEGCGETTGCKSVYSVELSERRDSRSFINIGKIMRFKTTVKHYIIFTADTGAKNHKLNYT